MRILAMTLVSTALIVNFAGNDAFAVGEKEREVGDLGEVGSVEFATTCDPAVQAEFERGLALLHSFFYDEARRVFESVASKDPECAMAYWGIAMTHYHPIWVAPDSAALAAGRAAVAQALAAAKTSDREAAYIHAVEAYYEGFDEPDPTAVVAPSCHGPGLADPKGRASCFKREIEKVSAAYPEDVNASAFFALSLLATAPPGDPALENQKQAAAILEKWYEVRPNHPGLAHYLIHSYDYPPLARRGLPAAMAYAGLAPVVPHALHMPSHIFTRLGMWPETIECNLASADAAHRYGVTHHPGASSHEELHALDYLAYGYLQTAQDEKAREVLDRLSTIHKTQPEVDFAAAYAFGAIPARFALERRQWKEAAMLEKHPMPFWGSLPFAEGHIAFARAVGAARSGDLAAAAEAADLLQTLAGAVDVTRYRYFADQMGIQRSAALGLIAFAKGDRDEGVRILREAAALEDSLGKHPVSPGAMLPVRELLAEALLDSGKPDEALTEFQASLAIYPARFNGLYGAARAASKAGREADASRYAAQLLAMTKVGDGSRPEIEEARALIARR
ncbi:MAG: tetratricopeptide repeat protein [bacterium]